MATVSPTRIAVGVVLSALLLTACGDVTVNAGFPGIDYTDFWWWSGNTEYVATRTISLQEPIEGSLRVRLEAGSGSITIAGDPDTVSIHMTAELTVGADTPEGAQEGLNHLGVLLSRRPDEILFQTDQPVTFDGRQFAVDYVLEIPEGLEISVTQTNGSVTIADMANQVNVEALNGTVRLMNIFGNATASVYSGGIDGTITQPPGGEILLSAVNGEIDLNLPASTSAVLSALTGNGNITWHNLDLADFDHTSRSLSGIMGIGNGVIQLETVNGDIIVTGF